MTLQVPEWMSQEAVDTLSRGYLWQAETPRGMWERVANNAARILKRDDIAQDLFDVLWNGYIGLATPVASNFGTPRGLPISCYSVHLSDSVQSIYSHLKEVAALVIFVLPVLLLQPEEKAQELCRGLNNTTWQQVW